MTDPRLGRASILIIAAGLAGLACFIGLNRRAFPQATVELAVDRNAAYERAAEFVAARGVAPGGREHAITMSSDGAAAVFLQRTPPVPNEPDLADMRIWHWRARWFRSQEKEEVRVDVGPRGQILSYEHLIPEAQAGTRIDLAQARSMAEHFLTEVMHVDLGTLEEVEAASKQLDHRVDHTFEWRVRGYERPYVGAPATKAAPDTADMVDTVNRGAEADTAVAGAGTLRHRVRIQGDEVGYYEYDYKVPEAFEREFSAATSRGLLLTIIAFVLLIVLGIAAVIVMVRVRTTGLRFRPSMVLGVVVLLANLVTTINLWPQLEASYSTQIPYPVFIGIALAGTLLVALIYGFIVLACAASGDHLARDQGLAPSRALGPVPRPSFAAATVHGYSFAFFFLGYVTLFYLLGRRFFGVWMPAEGPFSEVLSTALPALAPIAISILAAVSEESVFRLFAVPFLRGLFGKFLSPRAAVALALVLPAMVWAFAHSNYPVFPMWVRGVELTIAGVAFGLLFLHSGFLAVVIAHYVIDAVFLSTPLLGSKNPTYVTSGVIAILLAALPAVAAIVARRRAPAPGQIAAPHPQ